jgi:hypothetical protein
MPNFRLIKKAVFRGAKDAFTFAEGRLFFASQKKDA